MASCIHQIQDYEPVGAYRKLAKFFLSTIQESKGLCRNEFLWSGGQRFRMLVAAQSDEHKRRTNTCRDKYHKYSRNPEPTDRTSVRLARLRHGLYLLLRPGL